MGDRMPGGEGIQPKFPVPLLSEFSSGRRTVHHVKWTHRMEESLPQPMEIWHPAYRCFEADSDGFPKILRTIPDTSTMDFFRGLDLLPREQREIVTATSIGHANAYLKNLLNPEENPRPTHYKVMWNVGNLGRSQSRFFEIASLKIVKNWVGFMKSDKPGARRALGPEGIDPAAIEFADRFELIPATEMRKALKVFLSERFGLKASQWGGVWHYRSPVRSVGIEIDFSGSHGHQLRYQILHPKTVQMNLESMWGIGVGAWDYIHRENFDATLELLGTIYSFFDETFWDR